MRRKFYNYIIVLAGVFLLSMPVSHVYAWSPVSLPTLTLEQSKQLLTQFKEVIPIGKISGITIPTIVGIPLNYSQGSQSSQTALLEEETGRFLQTQVYNMSTITNPIISTSIDLKTDIASLHDSNPVTYYEIPSDGIVKSTSLFYTVNESITTSKLKISSAQYASVPTRVTIYSYDLVSNEKKLVVYEGSLFQETVFFPNSFASRWEIIFNHKEPLRITEIEFINDQPKKAQSLKFVAQPNYSYSLYLNPDRNVIVPIRENSTLDLNSVNEAKNVYPVNSLQSNPLYKPVDSDRDGISDSVDNCPNVKNSDQKRTVLSSSLGDACSDFDHDRIMNATDNCSNIPNTDQSDKDGDKIGDVCDVEESRLTEKYPWIPFAGILVGFGATFAIFATTARNKNTNVELEK